MAQNKKNSASNIASMRVDNTEFRALIQELAEEAEHTKPAPPPKVQELLATKRRWQRKLTIILVICCVSLGGVLFYGIKYSNNLPLGLGGIFKAYVQGTRAPVTPMNQRSDSPPAPTR
jgi:hypothetical protein